MLWLRRQTYSKIISTGGQNLSKRIALHLCIGAHATLREAVDCVLSIGGFYCATCEDETGTIAFDAPR